MKKSISLLLCILMLFVLMPAATAETTQAGNLEINATNFPDAGFRAWVKTNLAGGKSYMTPEEVSGVDTIDCTGEGFGSLKGVGKFPNLRFLWCAENNLKSLDLSGNTKLLGLECEANELTSLNISKCTLLEHLECQNNQLETLNVTANTKLTVLCASYNNLKSIDVSKNTQLYFLSLFNNQLTKLNVTALTKLETLDCRSNQISSLDLSKNTSLLELSANWNPLGSIDLSKNTNLLGASVYDCQLNSIDVSKNVNLEWIDVSENWDLAKIDVSKNPKLKALHCANTSISTLDTSKNPDLTTLDICECNLAKLDVSKNTKLEYLYAYACLLTEVDVSMLPELYVLNLSCNFIEHLDVTKNTKLAELTIYNNQIKYVNLSKNTKLKRLDCYGNRMEFLTLGNCPDLEELSCAQNNLRVLHLENNPKLTYTDISPQNTVDAVNLTTSGGYYYYNMAGLFETGSEAAYVKAFDSTYSYNASSRTMRMPGNVSEFKYLFSTGKGDMQVNVYRYYNGDYNVELEPWNGLSFKGTTPYMIWNGTERRPDFVVRDKSTNQIISPWFYDFGYQENTRPGTGYLNVRMFGNSATKQKWFKIYLPPTASTTVANVSGGIKITWAAVPGAAGYVVYRRAWNATATGWTTFERWNNTTETSWIDTKVYSGTRYQYGIKAYFSQRVDPVSGATIGGNVGDNYNLGEVGPLKTTVRIKTNKLNSVTGGTGKLTAKYTEISVCSGYVVQVATNSTFTTGKKEAKVTSTSTLSKTISGLTSGKTYYVRVRGYNEFNGTTYYGEWSNVLNCKVN